MRTWSALDAVTMFLMSSWLTATSTQSVVALLVDVRRAKAPQSARFAK